MTKTLSSELLAEITNYNQRLYEQSWSEYLNKIKDKQTLSNLMTSGFTTQQTIEVKNYFYCEYLTTYTGSAFYNTLAYIKTSCEAKTYDTVKIALTGLNLQLQDIISNGFMILEATENNIVVTPEYNDLIAKLEIELYQEFLTIIKKELGTKIIPSILTTYLSLTAINEELELKKHQLQLDKSFKIINAKVQAKTESLLEVIYQQFALKSYHQQSQTSNRKVQFADFSNDHLLFKIDFNDQAIALETLGLQTDATFSDIKRAYKQLAAKYHPDNNKSPNAELEMKRLNIAYNLLKQISE
ncbi:J domain-containing protein [Mesoplasma seiffertii]|uniref:J domain-containing protein n=1 Tax=Mesoplasma seiffertii TaxID=28224 RepID=UPI00068720CD|nr:J domain-containing protein [Mesoplasma seiffertii]